jgi:hypothetical protein
MREGETEIVREIERVVTLNENRQIERKRIKGREKQRRLMNECVYVCVCVCVCVHLKEKRGHRESDRMSVCPRDR